MCFGGSPQAPEPDPLPPTPRRDENSAASQTARDAAMRMKGAEENIGTTPLGDPNAGANRVTVLGGAKKPGGSMTA